MHLRHFFWWEILKIQSLRIEKIQMEIIIRV